MKSTSVQCITLSQYSVQQKAGKSLLTLDSRMPNQENKLTLLQNKLSINAVEKSVILVGLVINDIDELGYLTSTKLIT